MASFLPNILGQGLYQAGKSAFNKYVAPNASYLWDLSTNPSSDAARSGIDPAPSSAVGYIPKKTTTTTSSPYNEQLARIDSLLNSLKYQTAQPTLNKYFSPNYTALYNQATQQVNPYFASEWTAYQNMVAEKKKRRESIYQNQLQDYQNQLGQAEEETGIRTSRTREDVAQNLSDLATGENIRQGSEARQYDLTRRGLQEGLGESGLTTSGIGRQQLREAQMARGETEQAQKMKLQQEERQQKLTEERTIGDLARNLDWTKKGIETGKKGEELKYQWDIDSMLWEERTMQQSLETRRQLEVMKKQEELEKIAFQNYFKSLGNNQQRTLAGSIYSRLM